MIHRVLIPYRMTHEGRENARPMKRSLHGL